MGKNEDNKTYSIVDGFINQGIDAIASHIPGGETVEQMLKTEIDQDVNNAVNSEVNKGLGGMMQDAERFFERG